MKPARLAAWLSRDAPSQIPYQWRDGAIIAVVRDHAGVELLLWPPLCLYFLPR